VTPDLKKILFVLAQVAFVVLAAFTVYGFVLTTKSSEGRRACMPACLLRPDYMAANRVAPDFTLDDIEGKTWSLSSLKGKVVVLNFWSKDCRPCLQEMGALADLAAILRERFDDVVFLSVTFDESKDEVIQTLRAILPSVSAKADPKDWKPPFPVLHDPENAIVREKFGTHLVPETWIIDKRGIVRARFDGARQTDNGALIWEDATVIELIDQIRTGEFCTAEFNAGLTRGQQAQTIEMMKERGVWQPGASEAQLAEAWGLPVAVVKQREQESSRPISGVCDAIMKN
jgi:peroxiredoxin